MMFNDLGLGSYCSLIIVFGWQLMSREGGCVSKSKEVSRDCCGERGKGFPSYRYLLRASFGGMTMKRIKKCRGPVFVCGKRRKESKRSEELEFKCPLFWPE
jgi:hypothetical protein